MNSSRWTIRTWLIAGIGGALTALGVLLLVLPGPAILVLPIGLAILGVEFAWARRWLRRFRNSLDRRAG